MVSKNRFFSYYLQSIRSDSLIMQLVTIALHHRDGRQRHVDFKLGALNILTGESKTGKSALLTIVDYCLGNTQAQVPRSPHFDTVAWYSTLWQLKDGSRFVLGRPAPHLQLAKNAALFLRGGGGMTVPDHGVLHANTDADSMRVSVSQLIGLSDVKLAKNVGSVVTTTSVGLGTAALFCLQMQDEIASRGHLFHRQGSAGKELTLQDTLPFFLGALKGDQASKAAELRLARRVLREREALLYAARQDANRASVELQALVTQAHLAGLISVDRLDSPKLSIEILKSIRSSTEGRERNFSDADSQDDAAALQRERHVLRNKLRDIMFNRELVLTNATGMTEYGEAVALQAGRLSSLELLKHTSGGPETDSHCPVCNSALQQADPTVAALANRLHNLREDLADLVAAQPATSDALKRLSDAATEARSRLRAIDMALDGLSSANPQSISNVENKDYVRGRIDVILDRLEASDPSSIEAAEGSRDDAEKLVNALKSELDSEASRDILASRLSTIGRDMTAMATDLELEHARAGVRLDIRGVRVVVDLESGPTPLTGIGSAANWIGYHLVAHLALHRFFVKHNRPVPNFLMLDQPTQAFYQSQVLGQKVDLAGSVTGDGAANEADAPADDAATEEADVDAELDAGATAESSGAAEADPETLESEVGSDVYADRDAVRRMFRLLHTFSAELKEEMQLIVVDHADEPDAWFSEAVVHTWRHGEKLVPEEWLPLESNSDENEASRSTNSVNGAAILPEEPS